MASICSESFAVEIIVASVEGRCQIVLNDNDPIDLSGVSPSQLSAGVPFSKPFLYAIGSNPNPNDPGFGFSVVASGVPAGVQLRNLKFGHDTPILLPLGFHENVVSGKIILTQTYQSTVRKSFNIIVRMNTGA